jgi:hypothetical protein
MTTRSLLLSVFNSQWNCTQLPLKVKRRAIDTSDIDNPRALSVHIFKLCRWEQSSWWAMLTKRQFADGPPIWADPNAKEHDEFKRRFVCRISSFRVLKEDPHEAMYWA